MTMGGIYPLSIHLEPTSIAGLTPLLFAFRASLSVALGGVKEAQRARHV